MCAGAAPVEAAERAFAPAFAEDAIDLAQCRQYVNGKASPADPKRVNRTLGFFPADGDWEENVWEVSGGADGTETVYQFMVVFRQPVQIGTLSASPADVGSKGSSNSGELYYLKPDEGGTPDPARQAGAAGRRCGYPGWPR